MGDQVRVEQVRQILRLVSEAAELVHDRPAMQRHVLEGLARIFGASVVLKAATLDFRIGGDRK